jgi:predicted dinucleotide-binding enzyme
MDITIIGAGNMGRGIALRAVKGGNRVTIHDNDQAKAGKLVAELEAVGGTADIGTGHAFHPVVVIALPFAAALAFATENAARLGGKTVVDITNPLNGSYDGLVTAPGTSAAQELAARLPGAHVVKAFNTNFAGTLAGPKGDGGDVFIAGDDVAAKASVIALVRGGGLNPVDAGPLSRAQQLEALGLLGITLQGPLNLNFQSTWKLVA